MDTPAPREPRATDAQGASTPAAVVRPRTIARPTPVSRATPTPPSPACVAPTAVALSLPASSRFWLHRALAAVRPMLDAVRHWSVWAPRVRLAAALAMNAARRQPRLARWAAALALVVTTLAVAAGMLAEPDLDAAANSVRLADHEASAARLAAELEAERSLRVGAEAAADRARRRLAETSDETVGLRLRLGADQARLARLARLANETGAEVALRAVETARADGLATLLADATARVAQANDEARRLATELAAASAKLAQSRQVAISVLSDEPVPPPVPSDPPSLNNEQLAAALAAALELVDAYADPASAPAALGPSLSKIGRATCGSASDARRALADRVAGNRREVRDAFDAASKKVKELELLLAPAVAQNNSGAELPEKLAKKRIELELAQRLRGIRRAQLLRVLALEQAVLAAWARHAPEALVAQLEGIVEQVRRKRLIEDPHELAHVARAVCEHQVGDAAPVLVRLLEELAVVKVKSPAWTRDLVRDALVSLACGRREAVLPSPFEKEISQ